MKSICNVVVGLGSTLVEPGKSLNLKVEPLKTFYPRQIVIPTRLSFAFLLTSFKLDDGPEMISSTGCVPVDLLSTDYSIVWDCKSCGPGEYITIGVQNTSAQAVRFEGCIIGEGVGDD